RGDAIEACRAVVPDQIRGQQQRAVCDRRQYQVPEPVLPDRPVVARHVTQTEGDACANPKAYRPGNAETGADGPQLLRWHTEVGGQSQYDAEMHDRRGNE